MTLGGSGILPGPVIRWATTVTYACRSVGFATNDELAGLEDDGMDKLPTL
jgi:hypothetical protein